MCTNFEFKKVKQKFNYRKSTEIIIIFFAEIDSFKEISQRIINFTTEKRIL